MWRCGIEWSSLAGLANAAGVPVAGPAGFGRGGRLHEGERGGAPMAAVVSGEPAGQMIPLVRSPGKTIHEGCGRGSMPRAQGFRYVCSDLYRRQAVQGLSG